jgi:hypothetical protein
MTPMPEPCPHPNVRRLAEEGSALSRATCPGCGELVTLDDFDPGEPDRGYNRGYEEGHGEGYQEGFDDAKAMAANAIDGLTP